MYDAFLVNLTSSHSFYSINGFLYEMGKKEYLLRFTFDRIESYQRKYD